jgi:hypothetical protein
MQCKCQQTITLKSYGLSRNVSHKTTSGAIQYGVPINVSCFCIVNLFFADTPKSAEKKKHYTTVKPHVQHPVTKQKQFHNILLKH